MSALQARGQPIVVAGLAETGPVVEDPRSIPEMVHDVVQRALSDADLDGVDGVVTASVDLFDGLTASNIAITEVVGAVMAAETRIAADGLCALIHAACQVLAGARETVLVVAHGKASMIGRTRVEPWALDPIHLQGLDVNFDICAGLVARALAAQDPHAEERWTRLAARRRRAAGLPPSANGGALLADPITVAMRAPDADAACAVVLRRGAVGAGPTIALAGCGHDLDRHAPGARALDWWPGLRRAWTRANTTTRHGTPQPSLDVAEPSCRYAHEEELFTGALGLDSTTLLSPQGGLFGGVAPVVAGLSRFIAVARHLRREPAARRGLAHGTWGPAGQGHALAILERVDQEAA